MSFLGPVWQLASQLELSDAQKDQIRSIAQSHAEEWKALLAREQQARQAQQAAIAAPQFDEVTIRQRSADLAAVDADAAVARARARGELLQVLTTAQQAKLTELESRGGRGRFPNRQSH
jgi:Spy/CpxP family protein refolding chaperone